MTNTIHITMYTDETLQQKSCKKYMPSYIIINSRSTVALERSPEYLTYTQNLKTIFLHCHNGVDEAGEIMIS